MPLGTFEVLSSLGRARTRASSGIGFPLSLAAHAAAVGGLALLPVLSSSQNPPVETPAPRPIVFPGIVRARANVPSARGERIGAASAGGKARREAQTTTAAAGPAPVADAPLVGDDVFADLDPLPMRNGPIGNPGSDPFGSTTAALPAPPKLVRASVDVAPPRRVVGGPPAYPDLARAARVEGRVVVECTIGPDGRISSPRVVSGHPLLASAALEAIARWVYTPTLLNGVPVSVLMNVSVDFRLR